MSELRLEDSTLTLTPNFDSVTLLSLVLIVLLVGKGTVSLL